MNIFKFILSNNNLFFVLCCYESFSTLTILLLTLIAFEWAKITLVFLHLWSNKAVYVLAIFASFLDIGYTGRFNFLTFGVLSIVTTHFLLRILLWSYIRWHRGSRLCWVAYSIKVGTSFVLVCSWELFLRLRKWWALISLLQKSCLICWWNIWKVITWWNKLGSTSLIVWEFGFFFSLRQWIYTAIISIISIRCWLNTSSFGSLLDNFLLLVQHFFIKVFIMIVSGKCFLNIFLIKKLHVLLYLLTILIFPFTIGVVCIKIVSIWWDKWSLKSLMEKIVPWKVSEPRMVLDILWPIQS